ncbi:MAG: hypothetical protein C0623_09170 [Desulfuromonas sp.]|nr:MAG: hypothetical protein C0623_09170 [Desulfuromonas sp.]
MLICDLCKAQTEKGKRETPHKDLVKVDERRFFKGAAPRSFEEQDYRCLLCSTKFTWSSNKNDHAWTMWQG